MGTTGESATLSFEQHIEVVKRTVEYAGSDIPVVAGSGAHLRVRGGASVGQPHHPAERSGVGGLPPDDASLDHSFN